MVSDTTVNFTLKRGGAYCFKMTVVNGNAMTPSFTVGNGDVLKTQFVAKIGNDYYYKYYATGTPGQSTGVLYHPAGQCPSETLCSDDWLNAFLGNAVSAKRRRASHEALCRDDCVRAFVGLPTWSTKQTNCGLLP